MSQPRSRRSVSAIEFIKPVEKKYELALYSEQPIETMPASVQITAPQPLDVERESGSFTISAADTVVDIAGATGLRRVNASGEALASFQFSARPFLLTANVKRIEPVLTVADQVKAHLEESRLLVDHYFALTVEKAGLYVGGIHPADQLCSWPASRRRGGGLESERRPAAGRFASPVLGTRNLQVQLEEALKTFPAQITLAPMRAAGAAHETALVGAAAAPGLRVKTGEMTGLREIPVAQLPARTDELLAFSRRAAGLEIDPGHRAASRAHRRGHF